MRHDLVRPRLLAIDLDGTLVDSRGQAHRADVLAIRSAVRQGVHVTIATGRLYSGTRAVARELGLRDAIACVDGSHVVDSASHATLMHVGLGDTDALGVRDEFARASLISYVLADDAVAYDARGTPYLRYVATWSKNVRLHEDVFRSDLWSGSDGVSAAVGVGTRARIDQVADRIACNLEGSVQVTRFSVGALAGANRWALIARAAGASKGSALRWLADRHGVLLAETVCVGDWLNDVPMFEVAGRSYAMGQAPNEVKDRATDVLDETGEEGGGVARVLEQAFGVRASTAGCDRAEA
jgi:Cof subfamily protein (haloacid dehalogenase superfamily)